MRTIIILVGLVFLACGCTAQIRAKKFGGNASVAMPAGQKVVNATWKDDDLWILTRQAHPGEQPETLVLRESSSWGVLEGKVTILEK
jgi:hypothetical protein